MNKYILPFCCSLVALALTGCVVEGVDHQYTSPQAPPGSPEASLILEINAAAGLHFDNGRVSALKEIAVRPNLPEVAQVHLANMALRRLIYDNSKLQVLDALVANPGFRRAAKAAILQNMNRLIFDNSRLELMRTMNSRGEPAG